MIRIGAVTIDTSHPKAFGKILETSDRAKYVGVFNDSFRNEEEVDGFVRMFGLEKKCGSLDELVDMCDIGFIHSCNWDRHIQYAKAFIKANKPVFIDKPIVGRMKDCIEIEKLVSEGAVILGASSVRYCKEIENFIKIPVEERGEVVSIFGTSGVDEFNYGIHVVEGICAIAGQGARSVKYLGAAEKDGKKCETYYTEFSGGITAVYNLFIGAWQPFVFTIMTTRNTYQFVIDTGKLYQALLEEIFNFMEKKKNRMATIIELTESTRIMLAGKKSKKNHGQKAMLSELTVNDDGFDGNKFSREYAALANNLYH